VTALPLLADCEAQENLGWNEILMPEKKCTAEEIIYIAPIRPAVQSLSDNLSHPQKAWESYATIPAGGGARFIAYLVDRLFQHHTLSAWGQRQLAFCTLVQADPTKRRSPPTQQTKDYRPLDRQ